MGTLGQRLAQNMDTERRAAEDSAAAWAQQRTDEARRKFETARTFFENAKTFFTQAIMSGAATKDVRIQVGRNTNREFAAVLDGYKHTDIRLGPDSLHDPKRFASLWHEFQQWAKDEGLTARWVQEHDGGGMESWWLLKVEPIKAPGQTH